MKLITPWIMYSPFFSGASLFTIFRKASTSSTDASALATSSSERNSGSLDLSSSFDVYNQRTASIRVVS